MVPWLPGWFVRLHRAELFWPGDGNAAAGDDRVRCKVAEGEAGDFQADVRFLTGKRWKITKKR